MSKNDFIQTALELGATSARQEGDIYVAKFNTVNDALAFADLCKDDINVNVVRNWKATVAVRFF